jgi:probable HAF family extracellular repeat protein
MRSAKFLSCVVLVMVSLISHRVCADENPFFMGLGGSGSGGWLSNALDVSGDGSVVVGYVNTGSGQRGAFRWTQQSRLSILPGINPFTNDMYAAGVSQDGSVIVGAGDIGGAVTAGFTWQSGTITNIGGSRAWKISGNGSVIVGEWPNGAAKYENGQMIYLGDLPGGNVSSTATGVSGDGSVIVGRSTSDNGGEAFRWEGGSMAGLGDLDGGCSSSASQSPPMERRLLATVAQDRDTKRSGGQTRE